MSRSPIVPAATEPRAPSAAGWLGLQLHRLERLMDLQQAHGEQLNPQGRRLLSHAIFVTYVDCRELGGEAPATRLIAGGAGADPQPGPAPPTAG